MNAAGQATRRTSGPDGPWDTIVIGSGMSGLTAAAALAKAGQRILLLEQHWAAGGLTQTFRRGDWEFATGVHYLAGLAEDAGPGGHFRRLLASLGAGQLRFAPMDNPYDIVQVGDFRFGIMHPQSRFRADLLRRFPAEATAIQRWFDLLEDAAGAARAALMRRGIPEWMAAAVRLWKGRAIARYARLTVADALAGIDDPLLRAVLGARGADYGASSSEAPLLEHALVSLAYGSGAYYPVGGPARIAEALLPVVGAAGGRLVLGADVRTIDLAGGRVAGVTYRQGDRVVHEKALHVISTTGVPNTLACLPEDTSTGWRIVAGQLSPGPGHVALYVGFSGDIRGAVLTNANIWFYGAPGDIGRYWEHPADEDAPGLFVSFPSLKDPDHRGGHTCEIIAMCAPEAFSRFRPDDPTGGDEAYRAFKANVEARMLAQFRRLWPALADRIAFHELSTPLSQHRFVRTPMGSMYGLEMSGRRLASRALDVRTPVPGLLIAGQDVTGPGLQPAAIGGLLAAGAIKPALLRQLNA